MWTATRIKDLTLTTNPTPPTPFLWKGFAKSLQGVWIFKSWATCLLSWLYNKPFPAVNSNILVLFGLIVHWAHRLAFSNNTSIISKSQDMEAIQAFNYWWMDNKDVVYIKWNTTQPLKNNKIMPLAATWMELETLILTLKWVKEKDKYHEISHIWSLLYDINEPLCRKETKSWTWRIGLCLPRRRGREWEGLGVWGW